VESDEDRGSTPLASSPRKLSGLLQHKGDGGGVSLGFLPIASGFGAARLTKILQEKVGISKIKLPKRRGAML
jgi:hypothetical protein